MCSGALFGTSAAAGACLGVTAGAGAGASAAFWEEAGGVRAHGGRYTFLGVALGLTGAACSFSAAAAGAACPGAVSGFVPAAAAPAVGGA